MSPNDGSFVSVIEAVFQLTVVVAVLFYFVLGGYPWLTVSASFEEAQLYADLDWIEFAPKLQVPSSLLPPPPRCQP